MSFTWGVEFETNLIYHNSRGKNRQTIWDRNKLKITSESWDVKLHQPNPSDQKYWVDGKPRDNTKGLFNLEAQLGVFKGFEGLDKFDKYLKKLDKKLKRSVEKGRFQVDDGTKYKLFGYDYQDEPDGLFLDRYSTIPGAYPEGNKWVGYRKTLNPYDIVGKPQLTMAFHLSYLPKLFNLLDGSGSEEFTGYYADIIMKKWKLKKKDDTLYGFILFLCHYYNRYLHYIKNKGSFHYFKTAFWIKPRTNPSTLYESLTQSQQMKLKDLTLLLDKDKDEYSDDITKYMIYIRNILHRIEKSLVTKNCVYSSGIVGINNSLYHYDEDSIETYFGMEKHSDHISKNIPCVDPYEDDDDVEKDPLPTLSSSDGESFFASSGFTSVWEWKSTGKGEVVYEFRDLQDLFEIALYGDGELDNPNFQSFFEVDMYTPSQLAEMIRIIFQSFFRYIFSDQKSEKTKKKTSKSVKKTSCKKGKEINKNTGRCIQKCKEGTKRSKKSGKCLKSCKPGLRRSQKSGRCLKSCKPGTKRSKKSGRCLKSCKPGIRRSRKSGRCVSKSVKKTTKTTKTKKSIKRKTNL